MLSIQKQKPLDLKKEQCTRLSSPEISKLAKRIRRDSLNRSVASYGSMRDTSYFEPGGLDRPNLVELSTKMRAQKNLLKLKTSKGETLTFNIYRDKDVGFQDTQEVSALLEDSIIESVRFDISSFFLVLRRGSRYR